MKILINVNYRDNTNKFWFDSSIKNMSVEFNPKTETVHSLIKTLCEEQDCMELTYKGKPRGNIFHDANDGKVKIDGYIYRGKSEIYDRNMPKSVVVNFDVWVNIKVLSEFTFEFIN